MDTFPGMQFEPKSLHKYLYGNGSPPNFVDPSGYLSLTSQVISNKVLSIIARFASVVPYSFAISHFNEGPHTYRRSKKICDSNENSGCTMNSVFELLRIFPAPGSTNLPVYDYAPGWAWPVGAVYHRYFPEKYEIHNITVEGQHLLHNGVVERKVIGNDNGIIEIETYGYGEGRHAFLNELFSDALWDAVDGQIIRNFR